MDQFSDPFREETLDFKKLFRKYIHLWPWFVVSVLAALVIAHIINKTQPRIYETNVSVLIHEDDPMMNLESQLSFQALALSTNKIQNEVGILKSRSLTYQTIKKLRFGVSYFYDQTFRNSEIYPNPYFVVEFDSLWPLAVGVPFEIQFVSSGSFIVNTKYAEASLYSFKTESFIGKSYNVTFEAQGAVGQWIEHPAFKFRVLSQRSKPIEDGMTFKFVFNDIGSQVSAYRKINISDSKNSSIVSISTQGNSRQKNADFLNMLTLRFLMRDLEKREQKAQKTIDFIEEQLSEVSHSLFQSESQLERFRSSQKLINIDYQSMQAFGNLEKLQNEKALLHIKEKYYQYLTHYLELAAPDDTELVAPSSLGVDDPLLNTLINDLVKLYSERADLLINSRRDNPLLSNIQARINNQKTALSENLRSLKQANDIALRDLDARIEKTSEKISQIPESQRQLFTIERQFNLYDAIYTFLQNKKSEIQILKSGFTPVHEIIDPASSADSILVSPKVKLNYLAALFIGLLLPLLVVMVFEFFNDKITSPEDLDRIIDLPMLGYIALDKSQESGLISFSTHNILAESFRTLRTNAQFIVPAGQKPVVLVTSTLLSEGKTFVSINLAAGFGKLGKKTVLVSFDLRKPKTQKYLNISSGPGLSNFLSSKISPEEIIHKDIDENLDVVFSGQIPPNPTELVASERTREMMDYLIANYDMIVIDSPPVGMAPDALLLLAYSNTVLYIVRHQRTPRKLLEQTLKHLKNKGVSNINLVLNGLPKPGRFSYYTSYGYHYGYFENSRQS